MSITVGVVYHFENGSWWADSDDAPGYYAGADTLEQLREYVHEGLEFHFEDSVVISEEIIEMVTTTHPRDDVEIAQTVRHQATQMITLASNQLTTSRSRRIKSVPVSTAAVLPPSSTTSGAVMAG